MNNQIRKIFIIVLIMFALLGVGVTNTQFISASSLNADARNQRTILHAAETDRGPIIVDKTAIASSEREQDSKRYARSYAEGPLYAPVTGYFSSVGNASTGIEAAEHHEQLDGQREAQAGGQELAEAVAHRECRAQAALNEYQVQDEDRRHAGQAQFLGKGGEDEVGVRQRHELRVAAAPTGAHEAAGSLSK